MQARLLTRAFAGAGHVVQVVAPRLDTAMPCSEMIDGVLVTRLAYPRVKLLGALFLCLRFLFWLWRRRHEIDAVHVHIAKNLAAVAGLLRPWLDATVTVKISGAWEFEGGILDPRSRRRLSYRLFNWCIRRVDNIQCISEATRRMVTQAGYPLASIRMIPNAVDLERFASPDRTARSLDAPQRVVYLGRIRPVKGLAVLMDAWSTIAARTNARLTIAGGGAGLEALIRETRDRGFADTVDFLGHVSDAPSVLADGDIYVQPSFQEGLPNSVLEAMAMELPIVATRVSGNEDVVVHEENGLLVPAGDAAALAAALQRLIANPMVARRMGARSRQLAAGRFGVPTIVRELELAYKRTS